MDPTLRLLLTRSEAAKMLAIYERTLFTLTQDGTIPSVRIGRSVRYRVAEIETALDRLQRGSGGRSTVG
jgi:excisionase family DNA binding protein